MYQDFIAFLHSIKRCKTVDLEVFKLIKQEIREELEEHGICHAILETEDEACEDIECHPNLHHHEGKHHHHHH